MNATIKTEDDHARANACGWYESICELVAALECDYDRLHELDDLRPDMNEDEAAEYAELNQAATIEGEIQADADAVRERIQEGPLSVEVRSGWYTPGGDSAPEDFAILLSTGGPALRIRGELDEYLQPCRAWLEYQDWGTPWTHFYAYGEKEGDPNAYAHTVDTDTILTYCQQFYFGE